MKPKSSNVKTIQFLRGMAAWAVVYHHFMQVFFEFESTTFIGWFFAVHGRLGVDIFFIVSGFVMHYTLSARNYTPVDFALRRIIRIVPAYWTAITVLIMAASVGIVAPDYKFALWDIRSVLLSFVFVPHEHLSGLGALPVLTVGWTLNFEMVFYALLTLSILFFRQFALPAGAFILICLPFLSDATWLWGPILTSALLYEFVIGMLISYLFRKGFLAAKTDKGSALWALGLLILAAAYLALWGPYYHFVVSALVVFSAVLSERWTQSHSGPVIHFLEKTGDRSYSAYLYHPLILFMLLNAFGSPKDYVSCVALLAVTTVLTALMSSLSFSLIEQKFGRWLQSKLMPQ